MFFKGPFNTHLHGFGYGWDAVGLPGAHAELCGLVDLPVHKEHHAERQVEGAHGGEHGVGGLAAHLALLAALWVGLPPAEKQRGQGDDSGERPGERDHDVGDAPAGAECVFQVTGDGPVAVQRDGRHVPDAGGAAEHIARDPQLAQPPAQPPAAPGQLVHQAQRHDQSGYQHVRDGHGRHQIVRNAVKRAHAENGRQHQQVPGECGRHQEAQQGQDKHPEDGEQGQSGARVCCVEAAAVGLSRGGGGEGEVAEVRRRVHLWVRRPAPWCVGKGRSGERTVATVLEATPEACPLWPVAGFLGSDYETGRSPASVGDGVAEGRALGCKPAADLKSSEAGGCVS